MTVHIVVSHDMPVDSAQVFDVIHDYRHRLQWDTLLRRAYTVDDIAPARDVVAVCTARWALGGYSFRTRYVTFHRPGPDGRGVAAIKLESRPPFFATWAASIRHEAATEGASRVTYTMTFTARPHRLAVLIEPVARLAFRYETRRRLRALASFLARSDGRAAPTQAA